GGEIIFIIFSPIGKAYSFRHPFVKSVAKRFWTPNQPLNETNHALVEDYHKEKIYLLVQDLNEVHD
ncbi:hypothetical protein Gotur_036078, partial [Gossypium turneri]